MGSIDIWININVSSSVCIVIVWCVVNFRKKELEAQVKESEREKARARNAVGPSGDIYDEMNGEIARHEAQKKKLSKYLSFLLNKDPQGLQSVNQKRLAQQKARQNKGWF